jgi:hypothetical protein
MEGRKTWVTPNLSLTNYTRLEEWTFWDSGTRGTSGFEKIHSPFILPATFEQLRRRLALLQIYLVVIGVETFINRSTVSDVN